MERKWVGIGAALGALAVALGAFGAHGLAGKVEPSAIETWKTGAHYHLIHAVVLTFVGLSWDKLGPAKRASAMLFCVGILIFGGTLYGLVLTKVRILGAVTPLGGVALILAWSLLALSAYQTNEHEE